MNATLNSVGTCTLCHPSTSDMMASAFGNSACHHRAGHEDDASGANDEKR